MGEIRSALEIALARTENVKSDKEGLKAQAQKQEGKRLLSSYLYEHRDIDRLKADLKEVSPENQKYLIRGAFEVLRANLILPQGDLPEGQLPLMEEGFSLITGKTKKVKNGFLHLTELYRQYKRSREQLRQAVKAQIMPRLQAKARELGAQFGGQVKIDPEAHPEFLKIFAENLARVNEEFQVPLDQIKEELEKLLD